MSYRFSQMRNDKRRKFKPKNLTCELCGEPVLGEKIHFACRVLAENEEFFDKIFGEQHDDVDGAELEEEHSGDGVSEMVG